MIKKASKEKVMKAVLNFLVGFFKPDNKNEYIGLTSFKTKEIKTTMQKEASTASEKTALTGLLKRVG